MDDKTRLAFEAVATGEVQALNKALADGVAPNSVNDQGLTLLILAAATGQQRHVASLLGSGANPNAADPRGLTPLMYAAAKGHEAVIRLLLDKEASPDRASLRGLTALMFAASEGHSLALRALLEGGANEGRVDEDGRTALLYAAYGGQTACVRRLLAHGADPTLRDRKGKTALDAAVELGFREVEALLRGSWTATHAPAAAGASAKAAGVDGFESLKAMFNGDATLYALASLEKGVAEAWKRIRGEGAASVADAGSAAEDLFGKDAAGALDRLAASASQVPSSQAAASQTPGSQTPGSPQDMAARDGPSSPIRAEDLVGQKPAKDALAQLIAVSRLNQERAARGLPRLGMTLHASFEGGRGTGKTTFARYYAQELRGLGLLSKGHVTEASRAELVSEYKAQTPAKTKAVVESARGGVLLIDEAYTLKTDDDDSAGQECLDTLSRALDDQKGDLAVVFAGHAREMRDFMQKHPGLKGRVPHVISFADFNDEELGVILERIAAASKIRLTVEARREALRRIALQRRGKSFGNAREVRRVFESALAQQSARLAKNDLTKLTEDELCTLIYSDITEDTFDEGDELAQVASGSKPRRSLDRLHELIGLHGVKREIQSLADYLRVQKARLGPGAHGDLTTHMIFAGNPGTGKTTVARLLGDLFCEIGLLATGHLVETDRSGLVGGYVGQTALKTRERLDEAMGGVLFVDEAYALYRGSGQDDSFGREAIDTLLKAMEDNRGGFVLVLAGYTGEMETFLSSNPGLKSRFGKLIVFDDYTAAELEEIARSMLKAQKFTIAAAAMQKLMDLVEARRKTERHFANAREVRNLLEAAYKRQASRIMRLGEPEKLAKEVVDTIEAEDVG